MNMPARGQFLYLIGMPGSGKTTVLARALSDLPCVQERVPFKHIRYPGGVQLGEVREGFSGTDALAMNAQPGVLVWLRRSEFPAVVAEGDRLANASFFHELRLQGWELTVAYLRVPIDIGSTRSQSVRRTYQSPAWFRGRATKVERLATDFVSRDWVLDARLPPDVLAARLAEHPVIQRLGEGPSPVPTPPLSGVGMDSQIGGKDTL